MAGFRMCGDCARSTRTRPTGASTPSRSAARPAARRCAPRPGRRAAARRPGPDRGRAAAGRRGAGGQGPRRLPPGRGRRVRAGGGGAAGPQAPGGQAVRGDGRRPGRGAARWARSTRSRPGCSPAGAARSCCCRAARTRRWPPSVAPGNREVGVMLPYTPLHHLLAAELGRPIVLTSGNASDEPIAVRGRGRLPGWPAGRRGSAARPADPHPGRRLGGPGRAGPAAAAPPVPRLRARAARAALPAPRPVLGCGAELKNTFCLPREGRALLSHHIGDLEN